MSAQRFLGIALMEFVQTRLVDHAASVRKVMSSTPEQTVALVSYNISIGNRTPFSNSIFS